MSNDEPVTHSDQFTLTPGGMREVNDATVDAFDSALSAVGTGELMHFIDPRRIQTFEAGGPPVWSVATVPVGGDTLYLTYGLSKALDRAQRLGFEMSVRVRGEATMWPALFLRGLCRYMIGSGRTLEVGQFMPFPAPITRFAVAPSEAEQMPATTMSAACFATDPALPSIRTPFGEVEVRRAFGIYGDELTAMELWSAAGFVKTVATSDTALTTDISRPSYAPRPEIQSAIREGSAREGSAFGFVAVPGVHWGQDDGKLFVAFPGGEHAARIHRMIQARLPFGRNLLVHDIDPANQLGVAFVPSQQTNLSVEGPNVVLSLPPDHALIGSLTNASHEGLRWDLG